MQIFNTKAIYKTLRRNAYRKVRQFRTDWRVDRNILRTAKAELENEEMSRIEFVHVASPTGTHLWFLYFDDLDVSRPYLFGTSTSRKIMQDVASIFAENSQTLVADIIIQYFDGTKITIIDKPTARTLFLKQASAPRSNPLRNIA